MINMVDLKDCNDLAKYEIVMALDGRQIKILADALRLYNMYEPNQCLDCTREIVPLIRSMDDALEGIIE